MEPKRCQWCGREFSRPAKLSLGVWEMRRFCSWACSDEYKRGRPLPANAGAKRTLEERFWEKVDTSGGVDACWPWMGNRMWAGYGVIMLSNTPRRVGRAHRVAYELTHGVIPEGLCVLHRCDNPPCVNPAHLFLGTLADNNEDRERKGRGGQTKRRGIANGAAKLTPAQAREIRSRCAAGESQTSVARDFPVGQTHISRIVRGALWNGE